MLCVCVSVCVCVCVCVCVSVCDHVYLFHSILNHPLSNGSLPLSEGKSLEAFVHACLLCQCQ